MAWATTTTTTTRSGQSNLRWHWLWSVCPFGWLTLAAVQCTSSNEQNSASGVWLGTTTTQQQQQQQQKPIGRRWRRRRRRPAICHCWMNEQQFAIWLNMPCYFLSQWAILVLVFFYANRSIWSRTLLLLSGQTQRVCVPLPGPIWIAKKALTEALTLALEVAFIDCPCHWFVQNPSTVCRHWIFLLCSGK